ncbi:hypothetical protein IMZ11_42085, partial [Microtetraspora sp. AC03309]|uniref:hypothetical protein n=1 Tax=Microtetraspora sp. AC03309 TaxID=2779376 RepID=UPI001E492356
MRAVLETRATSADATGVIVLSVRTGIATRSVPTARGARSATVTVTGPSGLMGTAMHPGVRGSVIVMTVVVSVPMVTGPSGLMGTGMPLVVVTGRSVRTVTVTRPGVRASATVMTVAGAR